MNIEKVMNAKVSTCRPEDSLNTAAKLMWEHDIGSVAVVDSANRPIGMLTDRDVGMSAYISGKPLPQLKVSEAMSKEIYTVRETQSTEIAGETMRARQVRRLPVVNADGRLVGLVSLNDLALAAGRDTGRAVNPEQLTAILASICQPRRGAVPAA